jgi:DNA-binding transcriptional MerR regulator
VADEERYGIAELAEAAEVSVRTVRYYIAEGLLPPAVTAGARSYYTREHLDRLRVIGRMKDAFLPLREIRRHLTGLDDGAIREIADASAVVHSAEMLGPADEPLGIAEELEARYEEPPSPESTAFIYGREDVRPAKSYQRTLHEPRQSSASEYIARVLGRSSPRWAPLTPARSVSAAPSVDRLAGAPDPAAAPAPSSPEAVAWRRIRIGDDAELLIREDAYHRRRDKIDWLVDWARKVFG